MASCDSNSSAAGAADESPSSSTAGGAGSAAVSDPSSTGSSKPPKPYIDDDDSADDEELEGDSGCTRRKSVNLNTADKWPITVPPMLLRTKRTNLPRLQMERQIGRTTRMSVQRQCQLTRDLINRLGLSSELHGHRGCVNCIEFDDTGRLLVSGSDDYQLLLWDVHSRKKRHAYTTSHSGNIFSVKFLPSCGTGLLVSGAGDKRVEVRDLNTSHLLHVCTCHSNRVKRVATSPDLQHTFFSASEDGTVLQYDLRAPHRCNQSPSNVMVDLRPLRTFGFPSEVKCAAVSPRDPFKLAVGANDPFVRIYDRRMIKLARLTSVSAAGASGAGAPSSGETGGTGDPAHLPPGCCQYYVPGHLPSSYRDLQRKFRTLATTYLSYSPDGRHLLANLGGENIYLYDTMSNIAPVRYTAPPSTAGLSTGSGLQDEPEVAASLSNPSNGITTQPVNGYHATSVPSPPSPPPHCPTPPLPAYAESLKKAANERFQAESWVSAVMLYSEALQHSPDSAVLFSNRAAALMRRNWEGDTYSALRDCFRALAQDPTHPKAYHRMAKCLQKLGRNEEAKLCMDEFKKHNTESSRSLLCSRLYTEILDSVFQNSSSGGGGANGSSSSSAGASAGTGNSSSTGDNSEDETQQPAAVMQEQRWRAEAGDYLAHYAGHCNTTTDIKEAVFLGQSGDFVAAGSDDGNLFVWETATGNVVRLIPADENIVNCVQCHPSASLVATSGIGHSVKLWEPRSEVDLIDDEQMEHTTRLNQSRMSADPLEMLFMHMGDLAHVFNSREGSNRPRYVPSGHRQGGRGGDDDEEEDDDDDDAPVPQHAIEFLRIPRPEGGEGNGGEEDGGNNGSGAGAGNVNVPDVQCRTC